MMIKKETFIHFEKDPPIDINASMVLCKFADISADCPVEAPDSPVYRVEFYFLRRLVYLGVEPETIYKINGTTHLRQAIRRRVI